MEEKNSTHVYPLDDLREHETDGGVCWCSPEIRDGLIVHISADGRELLEQLEVENLAAHLVSVVRDWEILTPDEVSQLSIDRQIARQWLDKRFGQLKTTLEYGEAFEAAIVSYVRLWVSD